MKIKDGISSVAVKVSQYQESHASFQDDSRDIGDTGHDRQVGLIVLPLILSGNLGSSECLLTVNSRPTMANQPEAGITGGGVNLSQSEELPPVDPSAPSAEEPEGNNTSDAPERRNCPESSSGTQ